MRPRPIDHTDPAARPPLRALDVLGDGAVDSLLDEAEGRDEHGGRRLRCRRCGNPVSDERHRIRRGGSAWHRFTNPQGRVFEIGCYAAAPGCACQGPPSTEFSWFAGYAWRVALCAACGNHLGWRFEGRDPVFFGLILDQLLDDGDGS